MTVALRLLPSRSRSVITSEARPNRPSARALEGDARPRSRGPRFRPGPPGIGPPLGLFPRCPSRGWASSKARSRAASMAAASLACPGGESALPSSRTWKHRLRVPRIASAMASESTIVRSGSRSPAHGKPRSMALGLPSSPPAPFSAAPGVAPGVSGGCGSSARATTPSTRTASEEAASPAECTATAAAFSSRPKRAQPLAPSAAP
mmetsp:Transcript_7360/g.16874  ORF Transcript_7360/g.16874 Transcript_7360/m.16874 type:complete len:206 (-) Transcript_7360:833-1450(-)